MVRAHARLNSSRTFCCQPLRVPFICCANDGR